VIFGDQLLPKVLSGEKTVTRRPAKLEDGGYGGAIFLPCKYTVGRTYGVQPVIKEGPGKGRGGKAVARIRIISVEREPLERFTLSSRVREAHLEGFKDHWAFKGYWISLYGSYDPTQLVDRIEFELVEAA
jgi:hypothetical protein